MNKSRIHKHRIDFNANDYYYHYKARHKNSTFTQKQYSLILTTFFSLVKEKIINSMFRFTFPGVGDFYLVKRKQVNKIDDQGKLIIDASINWPATKKLWEKTKDKTKKVRYLNEHTFGFLYKLYWDRKRYNFINRRFYSFIPAREFKQRLSKTLYTVDKPLDAYIQDCYLKPNLS